MSCGPAAPFHVPRFWMGTLSKHKTRGAAYKLHTLISRSHFLSSSQEMVYKHQLTLSKTHSFQSYFPVYLFHRNASRSRKCLEWFLLCIVTDRATFTVIIIIRLPVPLALSALTSSMNYSGKAILSEGTHIFYFKFTECTHDCCQCGAEPQRPARQQELRILWQQVHHRQC